MKTFPEFLKDQKEISEAMQPEWRVAFKKTKMNGVDISDTPVTVKARDTREAILKAAKKVGISDKSAAMQLKTKSIEKQDDVSEAMQSEWRVAFMKTKINGMAVSDTPVTVKARDTREAILKAAKKMGVSDKSVAMQLKTKSIEKQDD
jgi:glutamate racemase